MRSGNALEVKADTMKHSMLNIFDVINIFNMICVGTRGAKSPSSSHSKNIILQEILSLSLKDLPEESGRVMKNKLSL